ncbi:MAG: iron-sulfur cluster insertion protein ErpA [Proteobacteria bacterium]|nr:iron-sulfur cluster insertion protein ErpA [Pseudomonadota bacterium]
MSLAMNMTMSDSAAGRIAATRDKRGNPKLMLRVTVLGGGCSGFKYALDFDDQLHADDVTVEKNGAVLVTDESSLPFLQNAVVDYEQSLIGASFKIKNPNAASSCGCGNSFSTKM